MAKLEKRASGIVRTPTSARGGITEQERAEMHALSKRFIRQALRTDPIEPAKAVPAIHELYRVAGLAKPAVYIVESPAKLVELAAKLICFEDSLSSKEPVDLAKYKETLSSTCSYYQGGNLWAGSLCYCAAARDVLKLELPEFVAYQAWEDAALHGSMRLVHDKFCVVSDFPTRMCLDENHLLHAEDGPSNAWRDGTAVWHIHGVAVTEQIVMRPETLTIEDIRAEQNAEVRRLMIERRGEEWYIEASGMKAVAHDERFGTLYHEVMAVGAPICKVRVVNSTPEPDGTFKVYWLSVNPSLYKGQASYIPQAAVASTWRKTPGGSELVFPDWHDYNPTTET